MREEFLSVSNSKNAAQIVVKFPVEIVAKMEELFGDGDLKTQPTTTDAAMPVPLPLWVCQLLYKAFRGIPIAESIGREALRALDADDECDQDDQSKEQNDASDVRGDNNNKNNKAASNNNIRMRVSALECL